MKKVAGIILLTGASVLALPSCSKMTGGEDVFALQVGSCFDNPAGYVVEAEEVSDVPLRDCTEPHDNEAFYAYDLPDSVEMPSETAIEEELYTRCETAFAEYVGIDYANSYYDYGVYSPTPQSWANGDREILCLVYDPEGEKLTESLRGVAR